MLTRINTLIITITGIILFFNNISYSIQNPTFKNQEVIFYYKDKPRHYSERADSVKIRLINQTTNFEKTLELTRVNPNTWKIVIPLNYLFKEPGITKYQYVYYFIKDGKKILDPHNMENTTEYEKGINGRACFFKVEKHVPYKFVITRNPEIISTGLIFYYNFKTTHKVKLLITNGKTWTRVFQLKHKRKKFPYTFIPKEKLPGGKIQGKFYYKFIINGKYKLDIVNNNKIRLEQRGIFNVVNIKTPSITELVLPANPVTRMQGIYFYCKAPKAKRVGLLTSMNGWKKILPMHRSKNPRFKGVWVILLSKSNRHLPLTKGNYKYKFIVDGIITHDKNNPVSEDDGVGGRVSLFTLNKDINYFGRNPIHIHGNTYRFFFMSRKAKRIFLAGSFNNWNPYNMRLRRLNRDIFAIDITLHPGVYRYSFIVDNQWKKDPRNVLTGINQVGYVCSVAKIIKRQRIIR